VMMILVLAGIAMAGPTWWLAGRGDAARELVLYGNVDLRQVALYKALGGGWEAYVIIFVAGP